MRLLFDDELSGILVFRVDFYPHSPLDANYRLVWLF